MVGSEKYKDKMTTAAEAVSHVKSGEKIIFADWIGEPPALVDALVARYKELENVIIIHGMSPGPNDIWKRNTKDISTIFPFSSDQNQDRLIMQEE